MNLYISRDLGKYYYFSNLHELYDKYCFKCIEEKKVLTFEEWVFERATDMIALDWEEYEYDPVNTPKPTNDDYLKELEIVREENLESYDYYVKDKLGLLSDWSHYFKIEIGEMKGKIICRDHFRAPEFIPYSKSRSFMCKNCHEYQTPNVQSLFKMEHFHILESGLCNPCHIELLKTKIQNLSKNKN